MFFKDSHTKIKVILVVFDDGLSNKSLPIGSGTNTIDLTNGTVISHLNDTLILCGYSNSLLFTSQSCEFGMVVHDRIKLDLVGICL